MGTPSLGKQRSTFNNSTMIQQQGNSEDSPEFDEMYGFLSREDKQRLKKSSCDENGIQISIAEFLKVMRSLR